MGEQDLRAKLEQRIEELPVLPQAVVALMGLDADGPEFFDELYKVVATEPNFAARVLTMANSALSGSLAPISELRPALSRIGSRGAANLVMALSVTRVFVPRDEWEKSLWRHALQVAVASRAVAGRVGDAELSPDEAYLCGLLHDVGRFVLLQEGPEALRRIDEGDWHGPRGLLALERSICGLTHAELGAMACERWKLPALVRKCVRDHHREPPSRPLSRAQKVTAIVHFADLAMFPSAMPGTPGLDVADDEVLAGFLSKAAPGFVRLDVAKLRGLLVSVAEEADAALASLGLA